MHDSTSFDWNADALATLKDLLAAGRTSREIAERLGVTRNAVIGKSRRIGLNWAARKAKPSKPPLRRPRKRKPLPFMARRAKPKPSGPVHFRNLEDHHCRWIPGEPSSQLYCGAERVQGSSYCGTHTRAAYASPPSKQRQSDISRET